MSQLKDNERWFWSSTPMLVLLIVVIGQICANEEQRWKWILKTKLKPMWRIT